MELPPTPPHPNHNILGACRNWSENNLRTLMVIFFSFQLIERAIKKGPEDPEMMKLANHWLLVSKCFFVCYMYMYTCISIIINHMPKIDCCHKELKYEICILNFDFIIYLSHFNFCKSYLNIWISCILLTCSRYVGKVLLFAKLYIPTLHVYK